MRLIEKRVYFSFKHGVKCAILSLIIHRFKKQLNKKEENLDILFFFTQNRLDNHFQDFRWR